MNKRDLPFHWESVSVDSITINLDRKRVPLNRAQRAEKEENGIYPYVGANNILSYINEYIYDEKILCVAEDGGAWGYNQKCSFIMNEKCWVNNHAHVLISKNNLILEYLKYYLNYTDLNMHINGATRGKLNKSVLNKIKIPLPPLAEQQKIAAILDAADQLRQKDQQLIDHYTTLSQSLFLEMFGDPVTNPMGWERGISIDYSECIVPGRNKPKSFSGGVSWITTNDLNHLAYTSESKRNVGLTSDEIETVRARVIPKDSIILTCVGDLGIISINTLPVVVNQQLHTFQCDQKYIIPVFMMYALAYQQPYMNKMASSTTLPYMNKTVCNKIPMIYPPIELQNQFAQHIEKIEQQKYLAQASLGKSETLFNSLLQRAFKGELTQAN